MHLIWWLPLLLLHKISTQHRIPLVVDATLTTPLLQQSHKYGIDVIIYSLSKWYSGHSNVIVGAIIDTNQFSWADQKNSKLHQPS